MAAQILGLATRIQSAATHPAETSPQRSISNPPLLTLTINPLPAIFRLYGMLQVIQKQRVNTLLLTYSSVKATFLCTAQAVHHCTPIAVIHMLICAV